MNKAAFAIYLSILILSPLLFGAVHTYAYTLMALGVLTGSLLLVIKNIRKDPKRGNYQFQFPSTGPYVPFFLLLVFLIFQIIPLPVSLLTLMSPEAGLVGQKSVPASIAIVSDIQSRAWLALSPYYYPVRMSIIRFTVYGLFFLGLTQVLNSQKRIELTVFLILLTGCFEALYGLAQAYSGSRNIWWFKLGYQRSVAGTYINSNHLAGLMEMGLLLAASFSAGLSVKKKKGNTGRHDKSSLRGRISGWLSGEQQFNKRALILFSGAVMGIGLVFSASRGGIIAAAGAMLCLSLLYIFRKAQRRKGFILLFLFMIISAYAVPIGVEYPLERFKYFDKSFEERSRYTQKTMAMFEDYSLAGVGVGNFQYAYPKYQAAEHKDIFVRHGHNDWAQFLAEGGIIGLCVLLAATSYFIYHTMRIWKKRSDPFAVCLGAAPLAAMLAMAIHSYSDFNLHIPANFLMLTAIMAIGYSALHLTRHHGSDRMLYDYHIKPLKYKGVLALFLFLGLIVWNGHWTVRHFVAEVYCNTVTNSTLNRDQNPPLGEIKKGILWDRWNATYWYKLARELMKIRDAEFVSPPRLNAPTIALAQEMQAGARDGGKDKRNDEGMLRRQMEIIRTLEEAARLNPFQAKYHLHLGWEYTKLWQDPDYHKKWVLAADLSMERAAYCAGQKNPRLHVAMGNYWVMRSKTIYPIDPVWETVWAKACWHYKKAQHLEKTKDIKDEIEGFVWRYYPDKEFVRDVLLGDVAHINLNR